MATDDDAVGPLEVVDRGAFAQEFGVGHDGEFRIRVVLAQDPLDFIAGANRDGRLGDDDGKAADRSRNFGSSGEDVTEIGMAIAAPRRRADRDEHRLGTLDALGQIGGERQAAALDVGFDQRLEARLEDRDPTRMQRVDLACVLVDANDVMTEVGKTCPRHQSDIPCSNYRDPHGRLLTSGRVCGQTNSAA